MSSEESESDAGRIILKPIPWRSDKVSSFFTQLDSKFNKYQGKKSSLITPKRVLTSDRPKPETTALSLKTKGTY